MKKLDRFLFRQSTRGFQQTCRFLLGILFLCAASACSANGLSSTPTLAPSAILSSTTERAPASPTAGPTATPQEGWRTYTSNLLQIAVDYPTGWQIREDASGVTFTSPQGSSITLMQVQTADQSPQDYLNNTDLPNTRCTKGANQHGFSPQVCFDTISGSTMANFIIGNGASKLAALVMGRNGDKPVFDHMVMSLRLVPQSP
jgi:hypothetical protein